MNQKRDGKNERPKAGLVVKAGLRCGLSGYNHSRHVLRAGVGKNVNPKAGLVVKSGLKGGLGATNHSRQMLRS